MRRHGESHSYGYRSQVVTNELAAFLARRMHEQLLYVAPHSIVSSTGNVLLPMMVKLGGLGPHSRHAGRSDLLAVHGCDVHRSMAFYA